MLPAHQPLAAGCRRRTAGRAAAYRHLLLCGCAAIGSDGGTAFGRVAAPLLARLAPPVAHAQGEASDAFWVPPPFQAPGPTNGVLASVPGHPLWEAVMQSMRRKVAENASTPVVELTGAEPHPLARKQPCLKAAGREVAFPALMQYKQPAPSCRPRPHVRALPRRGRPAAARVGEVAATAAPAAHELHRGGAPPGAEFLRDGLP